MMIGERIRQLRKERNWNQKELAKRIGITPDAVSTWETGIRDPRPAQRQKLAKAFGISEAELFSDISMKNISPEVLEALKDPVAVKALLLVFKSTKGLKANPHDTKSDIQHFFEHLDNLPTEKLQAILALCK